MKVLVTGSGGLVGSEVVEYYCSRGDEVMGIDNDYRQVLFGDDGSVMWRIDELKNKYSNYNHFVGDIRNDKLPLNNKKFDLVIHTAAQPSHDWAVKEPMTDFSINAVGTLNLLELYRKNFPEATFIFTSTNKVYGDRPNSLQYMEGETRWIPANSSIARYGFGEDLSIDNSLHSLFGASKVAADVLVQEYGKYFKLNTGVFRGGCLTGPNHSGVKLHGFLSYLVKCCITDTKYIINGYKGKQVRDNIHSEDLIRVFDEYHKDPRQGEVYNIGGGSFSNCSILEAVMILEELSGKKMKVGYVDNARIGDHIWYISDTRKFQTEYPGWEQKHNIRNIIEEIYKAEKDRA